MKILIDTHILLWWLGDGGQLTDAETKILNNRQSELFYSAVSIQEIAIKMGLGRLKGFVREDFQRGIVANGVVALPMRQEHAWELLSLPELHRDPFDRMLIAQARVERMHFMTHDENIRRYPVSLAVV